MRDSLRGRLLLWLTSILALTIVAFGAAVCYFFWRSLLTGVDAALAARAESIVHALRPSASGTFDLDLPPEVARDFAPGEHASRYYVIWGPRGDLIDRSDPDGDVPRAEPPATRTRDRRRELAIRGDGGATVLVGQDTTAERRAVWALAGTVAGVGAAALGLAIAGGWFLAGRALAPIARISRTAAAMSGGDLDARIAIDSTETELGQVARSLNDAFDQLHLALERQRRFTADASHELRTPLSIVSAEVEWALGRDRGATEYRASLETCQRAAARMRSVVEGLLTLARADAGELMPRRVLVALGPIVRDVLLLVGPLAEKRRVRLTAIGDPDRVSVHGDPDRLREAITNLVSNAIHYNVDDGRVEIAVSHEGALATVRVEDTGIGIAPEDLPRIFDRFYRADRARTREAGGAGLGLAVTKWIVESHGGSIACTSVVGQGSRFVVTLPAAVSPPSSESVRLDGPAHAG